MTERALPSEVDEKRVLLDSLEYQRSSIKYQASRIPSNRWHSLLPGSNGGISAWTIIADEITWEVVALDLSFLGADADLDSIHSASGVPQLLYEFNSRAIEFERIINECSLDSPIVGPLPEGVSEGTLRAIAVSILMNAAGTAAILRYVASLWKDDQN